MANAPVERLDSITEADIAAVPVTVNVLPEILQLVPEVPVSPVDVIVSVWPKIPVPCKRKTAQINRIRFMLYGMNVFLIVILSEKSTYVYAENCAISKEDEGQKLQIQKLSKGFLP